MNQNPDSRPGTPELDAEIAELRAVADQGLGAKFALYSRKSGPGWLQGAITLGGGSLAGALYLGVITGYHMMWLQPLAMILGVVMLAAISYVTLSTGRRPFAAINEHISPVLGWAWIVATLMANIVWSMPQFNLGRAAIEQNLLHIESTTTSKAVICGILLAVAFVINLFYESGSRGIRIFEIILKAMVGVVVLSFFGVVIALTAKGGLDWAAIARGHLPDFSLLFKPAPTFNAAIAATGDFASFWTDRIAADQRDIMMTAFGTAVGINMTFLLPYSMLRKGWSAPHRGLAIFDLSIGLIVPFVLATGCVVIAAASQFHTKFDDVLNADGTVVPKMAAAYDGILDARIAAEHGSTHAGATASEKAAARAALPEGDRKLAAMLVKRDNFQLASTLQGLVGERWAQTVFGIGVLGMALSTIIILMLINGFTLCEMFGRPGHRGLHLAGCLIAGAGGFAGPFLWGNAKASAALAVPTSVIGGAMIPIAYFTFLLLMNSRSLLGGALPRGARALRWNLAMVTATGIATFGSIWAIKDKKFGDFPVGRVGIGILALLFVLGLAGFLANNRKHSRNR